MPDASTPALTPLPIETPPETPAVLSEPQEELSAVEADLRTLQELTQATVEEQKDAFLEKPEATSQTAVETLVLPEGVPVASPEQDEVLVQVKKILEDELGEDFERLSDAAKERFFTKGNELARQLAVRIRKRALPPGLVHKGVTKWLSTIPRVNKYFLEQAAKTRTDTLLALLS